MGHGVVETYSGGSVSGKWTPSSENDRTLYLWHDDINLRAISTLVQIEGTDLYAFRYTLAKEVVARLPAGHISVRDRDGRILPTVPGVEVAEVGTAADGGVWLRDRFAEGYFIDKWGALKLPFGASSSKRALYRSSMVSIVEYFRERHARVLFPHYGTLLGYARSGSFLDHDDDVDMSIAVYASTIEEVVFEFDKLIDMMTADGLKIDRKDVGQFHVRPPGSATTDIDIFLTWGNEPLEFNTYFGVAGRLSTELSFEEGHLEGSPLLVPRQIGEILALTYGSSWRVPDPSFQFRPGPNVGVAMRRLARAAATRNLQTQAAGETFSVRTQPTPIGASNTRAIVPRNQNAAFLRDRDLNFMMRGGWSFGSNSLDDFLYSHKHVTPHVEMDFLLTADQRLVAAHDDHDIAPSGTRVADLLSSYEFHNKRGVRAPFLDDVLASMTEDSVLFIDLKATRDGSSEAILAAAEAIARSKAQNKTLIGIYNINRAAAERLQDLEINICKKHNGQLDTGDLSRFMASAQEVGSVAVCLESYNFTSNVLNACLEYNIVPILPIWSPEPEARPIISLMKKSGVRHFITPYPKFVPSILAV